MEMLQHLGAGFEAAFTLTNMMFICVGVTLGIIFGVTPGPRSHTKNNTKCYTNTDKHHIR